MPNLEVINYLNHMCFPPLLNHLKEELLCRNQDMKEDVVAVTEIAPISCLLHLFPSLN